MIFSSQQEKLKTLLRRWHCDRPARKLVRRLQGWRSLLPKFPTYGQAAAQYIAGADDPIRYAAVAYAIQTLERQHIPGSMAEIGVYRGELSALLHMLAPERDLYLFDTFAGFPEQDLSGADQRFRDTSVEIVKAALGDTTHVIFRQGYFPETARGLEHEHFAFVMLDLDLYPPTRAGLEFFYPRLVPGGYLFAHDYNSPESNHAVARAVNEFLQDKPEKIIELPDIWGSIIIRKI
ncbi:MAG: TylF/MycF family methyltransferase [candidate division KSB1 bacterium]|nr:TylF/MycF family methyltransferase [candidate division KSB1 bacterium]MDZ7275059.1 TylF/MycF family methyltransferase [candidate division KSB1 bacterium]MDZ7286493.1 TylF/MycF family methyltransferase [candidate division KSB1 bacterium]MDZ7299343.1 TylF/MycF family methyltransferase [candidate division KSB1 bacterium]MDZ7306329.1 TylF/MycF family methyltransferase [candidate division KSB1 bacterium]